MDNKFRKKKKLNFKNNNFLISLLREVQFNFPLSIDPYREIAKRLNVSENKVLSSLSFLKKKGVIKYIGPVLNYEKIGFTTTLVAMYVSCEKINKVVSLINSFNEVTHNYLRKDKNFNLWFTLITPKNKLSSFLRKIKKLTGVKKMMVLNKKKTFKIDVRFFKDDDKK